LRADLVAPATRDHHAGAVVIACVDVHYGVLRGAKAAVVAFASWKDPKPLEQHVVTIDEVQPYEPGAFYKRELPCIRSALATLTSKPDVVIVDAHVWLEPGVPGLGGRLLEAEPGLSTVIGVAKTRFKEAPATAIMRGDSANPLWIDEGGAPIEATKRIAEMHGRFRVPTLLRLVDQLARGIK